MKPNTSLNLITLCFVITSFVPAWAASSAGGEVTATKELSAVSTEARPLDSKTDSVDLQLQKINADAAVAEGLCIDKYRARDARAICLARAAENRLKQLMLVAESEKATDVPATSTSSVQEFQTELNSINSNGGVTY